MSDSLDVLLRILLDKKSVSDFEGGTDDIAGAIGEMSGELTAKLQKANDKFDATIDKVNDLKKAAASLQQIGQAMFLAGSALVGGIFLAAKTEADRIKESGGVIDETTARWLNANERITQSTQKIGAVAEAAVLPLLEKAADLAEKAADFIEKNPELMSAALKIGLWTAGIGAIGVAVSKGIRLYADLAYLAAQAQFTADAVAINVAANTIFEAALLMQGSGTGKAGTIAGAASKVTPMPVKLLIGAVLAGAIEGAGIATGTEILVKKLGEVTGASKETTMMMDSLVDSVLSTSSPIGMLGVNIVNLAKSLGLDLPTMAEKAITGLTKTSSALAGLGSIAADEAKGLEILKDLAEDEAKAERQLADDREKILTDATRDIAAADRSLQSSLANIAESLGSNIRKINADLKNTLADLASGFAEANLNAEREYQQQRADIIASGEEEARRIQEQARKELEDLEKEHARNVLSATNSRDALGLADEQVRYEERKNEIKQNAEDALAQARANTEAQLAEAARNYEEQRAQRLAEYEKQKEEAKAKADEAKKDAIAKAAEDRKEAMQKAAEEKAEIERRRQEALADLKRQFDNEQRERVLAANQAISDLGGALNAEAELRRKYYAIIEADLNAHMQNVANAQSSATSASAALAGISSSAGGYSASRTPSSLAPLRSMVGASLMQSGGNSSGGGTVVWNDYRKFEADVSLSTRRAITADTIQQIDNAIERAKRR